MVETYPVYHEGQKIGTVERIREGLYYRIRCHCRVADEEIHRLYADGEKIGVLIPDRGEWILETKVAAKRMPHGCKFTLDPGTEQPIYIRHGEEFVHLDKLRRGKLGFHQGCPVLIIT